MKKIFYKILLYFLKVLGAVKNLLFWCFATFWSLVETLSSIIRSSLGVKFYKWYFRIKKIFSKLRIQDRGVIDILGSRGFLQILFFSLAVLIALPHSKLYTKDISGLAGRDTILYSLVGPGDQDFEIKEVKANFSYIRPQIKNQWKQGAVSAQSFQAQRVNNFVSNKLITSVGGVVNPAILSDIRSNTSVKSTSNDSDSDLQNQERQQRKVIDYEIKPGDTLYSLSNQFGISVNTIVWANDGVSKQSYLQPGETIKILPVSGVLHEVTSGDTIGAIARKYEADIEDITEYNDLENSSIQVGQELIIPEGKLVQTQTASGETNQGTSINNEEPEDDSYTQSKDTTQSNQTKKQQRPPSTNRTSEGYIWPTESRNITQYFGWRHTGLDIADSRGNALYASRSGRVIKSECGWNGGYGCYIILQHSRGVRSLYAHAYKLYVQKGQRVKQGETIAAMGSTGRSTGPHIHFEVRINGQRKNPLQYIR